MIRFPKDCWDKNCEHFHVTDMSVDDLLCACDVLGYECDACDEDYCHLRCPLAEKAEEGGVLRECNEYEITIEKLMRVVHNYTDPIRIRVVMDDAWRTCDEAKHMRDFLLTECYSYRDKEEQERLLKYYKDVPVWNLTVWTDGCYPSERGRTIHMGIEAHCHYKDIREGWLAEKDAARKAKRAEYRKRRKLKAEEGE